MAHRAGRLIEAAEEPRPRLTAPLVESVDSSAAASFPRPVTPASTSSPHLVIVACIHVVDDSRASELHTLTANARSLAPTRLHGSRASQPEDQISRRQFATQI